MLAPWSSFVLKLYLNAGAYQKRKGKRQGREAKKREEQEREEEQESIKFMTHATLEQQKEQEAATILFG